MLRARCSTRDGAQHSDLSFFPLTGLGQLYALNQLWPLILKTSKLPDVDPPRVVFESSMAPSEAPTVEFKSVEEINNPRLGEEDLGPVKL